MSWGPQTIEEARKHRYGAWAGSPGRVYQEGQCMAEVSDNMRWAHYYQCSRKCVVGGFCKQHAPKAKP